MVKEVDILREVELGFVASETERRLVVGSGGVLCPVEGPEPHPGCFVRVSYLGGPLAPRPPPHSSVPPIRRC